MKIQLKNCYAIFAASMREYSRKESEILSIPEEIYTTLEEAQNEADRLNDKPRINFSGLRNVWHVLPLDNYLEHLKDNTRRMALTDNGIY